MDKIMQRGKTLPTLFLPSRKPVINANKKKTILFVPAHPRRGKRSFEFQEKIYSASEAKEPK